MKTWPSLRTIFLILITLQVIKIFKSRLFQALLDIQEFYELTLMDDGKSHDLKTTEAIAMATR